VLKNKSNWIFEKAVFEGTSLNTTLRVISATLVEVEISLMTICFSLASAAVLVDSLVTMGNLSKSAVWMV
jgi:hypothetical protein